MKLANPLTGDVMTVIESADQSPTQTVHLHFNLAPKAAGSPPHSHPRLTETFTVEKGTLAVRLGQEPVRLLTAGESVTIAPGTVHRFWNPTDARVVFHTEVTPGQGFERFMRTLYGLAIAGKTDRKGLPTSPLVWACLLLWADFRFPGIPETLQERLLVALYGVAEKLGIVENLTSSMTDSLTTPPQHAPHLTQLWTVPLI